jgi:uncharacterized membrane protein
MTAALVPPALILHIGAGAVGILSGAAALTARKGERLHRRFGNVFFVSMLTMSAMAIYLAATIPGQSGNLFGGAFTFYLVATAWATVRRKAGSIGRFEIGAFLVALGAAGATIVFIVAATRNPSLQATGSPLGAVYVFAAVASTAEGDACVHPRITDTRCAGVRAAGVDGLLDGPGKVRTRVR